MREVIVLRKQAVRRYLAGKSKHSICRDLGKSPPNWLGYWLERYDPDNQDGSLQNCSSAPREPHRKWSQEVIQLALNSRLRQEGKQPGYEYALIGAEAMHFELAVLGVEPVPLIRTIHHWIKHDGLVSRKLPHRS
ncbi:MAG: hypothetical protein U9R11_04180 [Chloroflexota bacterium]|nr:hypothetical protein [Chloroflexota bacterium]